MAKPIEFVHVKSKDGGVEKFIPVAKYEAQRDLWSRVGRKTVIADEAPAVEASAPTEGAKKSGQKAESTKESS